MNIINRITKNPKEIVEGKNSKEFLIIHDTDSGKSNFWNILHYLERKDFLSVHYIVDRDGRIIRYVDDNDVAFHAGISSWKGRTDMNYHSIGIEIVSNGYDFTDNQRDTVSALCRELMKKYNIKPENVLRHQQIAPNRRKDPRPAFYVPRWQSWAAFQESLSDDEYAMKKRNASEWVTKNRISNGERPDDPVTRAEVWIMLKRLAGHISSPPN